MRYTSLVVIIPVFLSFFLCPALCYSDPSDTFLGEEIDLDDIYSDLPYRFDIENASVEDFLGLPFFTGEDAERIVQFRDSQDNDKPFSAYIEDIPGLSDLQYAILQHLAQTGKRIHRPEIKSSFRSGFVHKPENETVQEGKYYFKLRTHADKRFAITALGERDASEPRAFDFYSASVSLTGDSDRMSITLGDYRPGYGQGLVFSRYGRSYVNGADVFVREARNVASSSCEESHFLRGFHIKVRRKLFNTHVWTSVRDLDATLDEDGKAVTIKDTGYHYTGDERSNLKEKITAARFEMNEIHGMELAITGSLTDYSPALAQNFGEYYLHHPEGSLFKHLSLDSRLEKGAALFFFEYALMDADKSALVGGVQIKKSRVRTGVLFRHYSEGFRAPRSKAFSSFGQTSNEEGVYSAICADLPRDIKLSASMDLARSLYRTYTSDMPLSRKRLSCALQSPLPYSITAVLSYRMSEDSDDSDGRWNSRLKLGKKAGRLSFWGWRTDTAWSAGGGEAGPYAEAALYHRSHNLTLDLSAGIFDIPSYSSRFYRFERNVRGYGWTGAVWGRGYTALLLMRWKILSFRYYYKRSDLMSNSQEVTFQYDVTF